MGNLCLSKEVLFVLCEFFFFFFNNLFCVFEIYNTVLGNTYSKYTPRENRLMYHPTQLMFLLQEQLK